MRIQQAKRRLRSPFKNVLNFKGTPEPQGFPAASVVDRELLAQVTANRIANVLGAAEMLSGPNADAERLILRVLNGET